MLYPSDKQATLVCAIMAIVLLIVSVVVSDIPGVDQRVLNMTLTKTFISLVGITFVYFLVGYLVNGRHFGEPAPLIMSF